MRDTHKNKVIQKDKHWYLWLFVMIQQQCIKSCMFVFKCNTEYSHKKINKNTVVENAIYEVPHSNNTFNSQSKRISTILLYTKFGQFFFSDENTCLSNKKNVHFQSCASSLHLLCCKTHTYCKYQISAVSLTKKF